MKRTVKRLLAYRPLDDTAAVRAVLQPLRRDGGLPVCPPWEGDLIHETISTTRAVDCLGVGFHTGSSAVYMLNAVRPRGGNVTSIEPNPDEAQGVSTVAAYDANANHEVIEALSHDALPRLLSGGRRFDFIFLDAWKTFDALVMDCYFATRLLRTGGVLFFDDHHMPSVRRAARLMRSHYGYRAMPPLPAHADWRFRLYLALIGRTRHMPFVRLQKILDDADAPAVKNWNFDAAI